jgi:hypothetical protein
LQAEHELRFDLDTAALDLVGRRPVGRDPGDLLVDRLRDLAERMTRRRRRRDLEEPAGLARFCDADTSVAMRSSSETL